MTDRTRQNFPPVSPAEAGQKLLRFLERRLDLPLNLLHRWLRTGQIRLNGGRCKPFVQVRAGDEIRLPPFAFQLTVTKAAAAPAFSPAGLPPLLGMVGAVWAFNKPAGLLVQPGRPGETSIAGMLAEKYRHLSFRPAPAHRLDRETSGVLLVGATYEALGRLHGAFRNGQMHKEYLAWCEGGWPEGGILTLRHYLDAEAGAFTEPGPGRKAALILVRRIRADAGRSLLQIRLLTGRKRQIRAQLAASGHPLCGDARFGGSQGALKLHSCRIILPGGGTFACIPPWNGEFAVASLPEPLAGADKAFNNKTDPD